MRLAWFLVAISACSAPLPPQQPRPSEPKSPSITIAAPTTLTWTNVASGSIAGPTHTFFGRGLVSSSPESPILAVDLQGTSFAALIANDGYLVRLIRAEAGASAVDVPLAIPKVAHWHRGSIAVTAHDVKVLLIIPEQAHGDNQPSNFALITATIDRTTATVTQLARMRVDLHYRIVYLARAGSGWLIAGYREAGSGHQGDAIAWSLPDGATKLEEPATLATSPVPHQYAWLHGDVAPDGTALVIAERPAGKRPEYIGAMRRGGAWTALGAPFLSTISPNLAPAGAKWLVARLFDEDRPQAYAFDPASATTTELDATWSGNGRSSVRLFPFGAEVVAYGGVAVRRVNGGITNSNGQRLTDGAIYDLEHGTVRPFAAPSFEHLRDAAWDPALVLPIGERLCLLGGNAYSITDRTGGRIHGAACLDRVKLAWEWLASGEPPAGCKELETKTLGTVDETTALVFCMHQQVFDHPSNWEWPGVRTFGPHEWSLWLVHPAASPLSHGSGPPRPRDTGAAR
jgi:hypothetical protein